MQEGIWIKLSVAIGASTEYAFASALGSWAERGYEVLDDRAATLSEEARALAPGEVAFGLYVGPDEVEEATASMVDALVRVGAARSDDEAKGKLRTTPIAPGWSEHWKEHFEVTRVSERLVIRPTWRPCGAIRGVHVIELDPGAAFGTGTHATTRLCLSAVDFCLSDEKLNNSTVRVLDLGTGSGILAVGAALLGARSVLAIDNDPLAVEVATENCWANCVDDRVTVGLGDVGAAPGEFDFVLANIMARPLMDMASALAAKVAPGGTLALSGVLREEAERVQQEYLRTGLRAERVQFEGEWSLLVFCRDAASA